MALPLLVGALLPPLAQAGLSAARARFPDRPGRAAGRARRRLLTLALHLAQPLARLHGRLAAGLTPWRRHGPLCAAPLWPVTTSVWSERRQEQGERLRALEAGLRADGACVLRGGRHDRWDLEVRGGFFGAARVLMGVEPYPAGRQLARLRWWPKVPARGPALVLGFALLAVAAARDHAWVAAAVLGPGALFPALRLFTECTAAMATLSQAVRRA